MSLFPYPVRLDRRVIAVGSYVKPYTTWHVHFPDDGINRVVLSSYFGASAGAVLVPSSVVVSGSTTSITVGGDYSAGPVMIGKTYPMRVQLTRPFIRDAEGHADFFSFTSGSEIRTSDKGSGRYTIRAAREAPPTRADRTKTTGQALGSIRDRGTLRAFFSGDSSKTTITLEGDDPTPVNIAGVEHIGQYEARR
jgi:hypothetical protein